MCRFQFVKMKAHRLSVDYMGLLMSHFTAETKYESSLFPKQISVEHTWYPSLIRYANEETLLGMTKSAKVISKPIQGRDKWELTEKITRINTNAVSKHPNACFWQTKFRETTLGKNCSGVNLFCLRMQTWNLFIYIKKHFFNRQECINISL